MMWEDIEDVMDNGIIDEETMEIIIDEVGVKNGILTFEQFYALVELVNQVSEALDGDEELTGEERAMTVSAFFTLFHTISDCFRLHLYHILLYSFLFFSSLLYSSL